jgi:hypothetical protein
MTATPTQRYVRGVHDTYTVVGDSISRGGIGAIFRTTDPKWVYKEYHSPDKAPPAEHLERLVGVGRDVLIRQGLPIGARPESSINWPVDIVRRPDGRIVGCVLPTIPDRYFNPSLGTVNTLDFLVMRRASPPPAKFRMIVLLRMAEILAFVHSKGLVHGDVNAKNVAWTVDPEPAAYLIDCDGMVPQSPPPATGVQASYWTDPRVLDRVIPAHDRYSDWYCLALAFYRGLLLIQGGNLGKQNGVWSAPGQIPSDLDPRVAALLRRGLTDPLDATKRPEPAEWARTMVEVYVAGGRYDDAALARLDKALNAPKPKPVTLQPTFTPLPQPGRPPSPAPQQRPSAPPPHQQRPYQPPPNQQRPYQPPPRPQPAPHWQQSNPPTYAPPPPVPMYPNQQTGSGRVPGSMARWAMGGGARWYVPFCLLVLGCWPIGAVVCALVLIQTLPADRSHPGRTGALVCSGIGLGVGVLFTLSTLVNAAN